MFKKGTRVKVVDEARARGVGALVSNGGKGTIGKPRASLSSVNVYMDGDSSPIPWAMPSTCVKRIRKTKGDDL